MDRIQSTSVLAKLTSIVNNIIAADKAILELRKKHQKKMKIDTNIKVVIIAPDYRRGESIVDNLRHLDVLSCKPEIITQRYQLRSLRNRIIIVNLACFKNVWDKWGPLRWELEQCGIKYVQYEERMTKEEFLVKVAEIYKL